MKKLLVLIFIIPLISFSQNKNNYSYLALGDSYTIGESVKESERWPVQLSNSLKNKLNKPIIIAKSGWTTDQLIDTLNKIKFNKKFDFVSLLIGVNNQYRGRSIDKFKQDFILLLNKSIILVFYSLFKVTFVNCCIEVGHGEHFHRFWTRQINLDSWLTKQHLVFIINLFNLQ